MTCKINPQSKKLDSKLYERQKQRAYKKTQANVIAPEDVNYRRPCPQMTQRKKSFLEQVHLPLR